MEYDFTLKFMLSADEADADANILVERLGEVGCNDALVGIGQPGRIALEFTREADSAKEAMFSALDESNKVIPEAKLYEVTPDFVGLSDVAELVGVSRQNMRKLMLAHRDSFPVAVHEGSAALWHLFPVLQWLQERAGYPIQQSVLDVSYIAMQINLAREARQIERQMHSELLEWVA